jgi:uncharacterized protein YqgV (UPF0045/DUF77 family)
MEVRAEFTTEPFHGEDEQLPAHVSAPADALRQAGLSPDLGPLGTSVAGAAEVVVPALAQALGSALASGATRITLTVTDADAYPGAAGRAPASTDLTDGLARLIAAVEDELGGGLSSLPRPEKQHAVRLLEERGAFEMRRSVDTVAEALGVTRFTVYNYLNAVREA